MPKLLPEFYKILLECRRIDKRNFNLFSFSLQKPLVTNNFLNIILKEFRNFKELKKILLPIF